MMEWGKLSFFKKRNTEKVAFTQAVVTICVRKGGRVRNQSLRTTEVTVLIAWWLKLPLHYIQVIETQHVGELMKMAWFGVI